MVGQVATLAGAALILVSVFVSQAWDSNSAVWATDWKAYVGVMFPVIVGLVVANLIAGAFNLTPPEQV
jgi:hypothetical protein